MNARVVQHQHGTGQQARQQVLAQESLHVHALHRPLFAGDGYHSLRVKGAQNRKVDTALCGDCLNQTFFHRSPAEQQMQGQREAALVQKHEVFGVHLLYGFCESGALVWVTLGGDTALFL